jgi:DnaJ like chaperone protein
MCEIRRRRKPQAEGGAARMSWWGKLLGGGVGFVLGGPLGALIGAAVGHGFDRGIASLDDPAAIGADADGRERTQMAFFTATFSVMGHLAKADGRVSANEIRVANSVMEQLRLSTSLKRLAQHLFTEGKAQDFPLDDVIDQFRQECRNNRNLHRMFMEIQLHAAYADGSVDANVRRILGYVARRLGFSELQLTQMESMVQAGLNYWRHQGASAGGGTTSPTLEDAYAILNTTPRSSDAEVKYAYRRLMSEHHPDKLVARGLPEEMTRMATEKTQEIKVAYDRIREARGTG